MDLEALKIFVEVMRRGGFAPVARDRNVAPSSISRAIAALENELGARLFQRTTRRLSPTEAGARYFAEVEPLIEELERAGASARDAAQTPTGTLRVSVSHAFAQRVVTPMLPAFAKAHRGVSVELMVSDAMVDLIAERVDLAIRLGPARADGLIGARLMSTRYLVVASPGYLAREGAPDAPGDLAGRECVLMPYRGFRERWRFRPAEAADGSARETRVAVAGRLVLSNALAAHDCAVAGAGPALLADWVVADSLRAGALVDLFPNWRAAATDFDTAAWLIYPSRAYLPLKTRAFIDALRGHVAAPAR